MNAHLNKAIDDLGKVEAIMYAIENTYLSLDVVPKDRERAEKAESAFYALWDMIRSVKEDLTALDEDEFVVEAIYRVSKTKTE